ncbi:MAG: hypothetical protein V1492_00655 [Candidatus Micrarchaeota archaeon]
MILRYEDRRDSCSKTGVAGNGQTEGKKTSGFRKAAAVLLASTALIATLAACGDDAVQNPPTTQSDVGSKKDTGYEPKDVGSKDVQTVDDAEVPDGGMPDAGPDSDTPDIGSQDAGNDIGQEDAADGGIADVGSKDCGCTVDSSNVKAEIKVDGQSSGESYEAYKLIEDVNGKRLELTALTTTLRGDATCSVSNGNCNIDFSPEAVLYADGNEQSQPQQLYLVKPQTVTAQLKGVATCSLDDLVNPQSCSIDMSGVTATTSVGDEAVGFIPNDGNTPTKEYVEKKFSGRVVGAATCSFDQLGLGTCAVTNQTAKFQISGIEDGGTATYITDDLGLKQPPSYYGSFMILVRAISATIGKAKPGEICPVSDKKVEIDIGTVNYGCITRLAEGATYNCNGGVDIKVLNISMTVGPPAGTWECFVDQSGVTPVLADVNGNTAQSVLLYSAQQSNITTALSANPVCQLVCE